MNAAETWLSYYVLHSQYQTNVSCQSDSLDGDARQNIGPVVNPINS